MVETINIFSCNSHMSRVRALLYTLAKKGALDFYVIKCTSYLPKQGRWFSPGTPASSTTKTGRHDIAEKLLQ
jgi:hypothetical protein